MEKKDEKKKKYRNVMSFDDKLLRQFRLPSANETIARTHAHTEIVTKQY